MIEDAKNKLPIPPRYPKVYLLGLVLLAIGLAGMCLAFIALVGGQLLSDWYDARHIAWGLPDAYYGYSFLMGFACTLSGVVLVSISTVVANRLIMILPVLSTIIFIVMIFPILARARPVSPKSRCMSHQRALATGFMMYAQDHNGRLPRQWPELGKYLGDEEADYLTCPQSKRAFHARLGYGYNSVLIGKMFADIVSPSQQLLIADSVHPKMLLTSIQDIDTARHDTAMDFHDNGHVIVRYDKTVQRGFVATFADGHVEFFTDGVTVSLTGR